MNVTLHILNKWFFDLVDFFETLVNYLKMYLLYLWYQDAKVIKVILINQL